MKNAKRTLTLTVLRASLALVVSATFLMSCKKDDDNPTPTGPGNLVQVAQSDPDFSALVAAVTKADLAGTLSGSTQYTVFAPTNAAFAKFAGGPLDAFSTAAKISAVNDPALIAALQEVLLYHVAAGKKTAADLAAGALATAKTATSGVNDNSIYVSKGTGGVFINGNSQVVTPDVQASNGVIHVIDEVLLPPTEKISEIVVASASAASGAEFTVLLQALQRPAAAELLTAADAAASNLTVFAPTDAAFQALLTQLGLSSLADVPDETLVAILQQHIVGSRAFSSDLSNGQSVPTLNGDLTIGVGDGVTVRGAGNGSDNANVVAANILATNGVIHVIDRVLLP